MDELIGFLIIGSVIALAVLVAVGNQKRREEARAAYQASLGKLKKDPTNPDLKQRTLTLGRAYSNLTRDKMTERLLDFGKKAQGADVALFFYAGHGIAISGTNYLLPIDADIKSEMDVKLGAAINIDLTLEQREFIAFLGPSGSGKSTLLRIIAGLETADSGEVWLEGRRIDTLPPGERGIAMVFQHYALYPHMSARENMAFGLKNARIAKDEIERRIADAADVLEITQLLDRKPAEMSGGQRQRVAIGRALVKEPKLFLLDEPLSNLDAALRLRTRVELAQLKQKVDAAVIMVTHDQAEAMTLADRIIVMNDRRIQQVGPPMEIYSRPANIFVAQFVGSPASTA